MQFDWSPRALREWRQYYDRAQAANWMQTWAYAQASLRADYLTSRLALISEKSEPIGIMCVQRVKFGPVEVLNLKRGPLWFSQPSSDTLLKFAEAFRREFPKSAWQRLRWMPEYNFLNEDSPETLDKIKNLGFKLRSEDFVTSWINIKQTETEIRSQLDQKWRNCLNKSQKLNLQIQVDENLANLAIFFNFYVKHVKVKKYQAPSVKFLAAEFQELAKTKEVLFIWSLEEQKPSACIAIVLHGKTASYRVGWNTPAGRKNNSHYFLLWKALLLAKERGCTGFDLGGLLPDEAPGLTHFKLGIGGNITKTYVFS